MPVLLETRAVPKNISHITNKWKKEKEIKSKFFDYFETIYMRVIASLPRGYLVFELMELIIIKKSIKNQNNSVVKSHGRQPGLLVGKTVYLNITLPVGI
mgnify:CR=1 FL=1